MINSVVIYNDNYTANGGEGGGDDGINVGKDVGLNVGIKRIDQILNLIKKAPP
jgi:hypothetical protein